MDAHEASRVAVKRLLVLPAAVLIHMCLGGVYAWSAFVPSLRTDHGLSASQAQCIFGLTIATFSVAMVLAGRLLTRWGPRCVGLLGGVLFACGHMIAASSDGCVLRLQMGFGLVGGASIGCGYVAALTTGVLWFPKHKGLVTGVVVAGFGLGTAILSMLATAWLEDGWTVLRIFRTIGYAYGAVVCLSSLLLFLSYGLAGMGGPLLGGFLHDWTDSYVAPITVSVVVAAAGAWWTGRSAGTYSDVK